MLTQKEVLTLIRNLPDEVLEHMRDVNKVSMQRGYLKALEYLTYNELVLADHTTAQIRESLDKVIASMP